MDITVPSDCESKTHPRSLLGHCVTLISESRRLYVITRYRKCTSASGGRCLSVVLAAISCSDSGAASAILIRRQTSAG
jgi:hypothetical protein